MIHHNLPTSLDYVFQYCMNGRYRWCEYDERLISYRRANTPDCWSKLTMDGKAERRIDNTLVRYLHERETKGLRP